MRCAKQDGRRAYRVPVGRALATVTLYDRDALHVSATVLEDGGLRIEGQDLSGIMGTEEIEYVLTVEATDLPRLVSALDTTADQLLTELAAHGDDIVTHRESAWLKEHGIRFTLWTRRE